MNADIRSLGTVLENLEILTPERRNLPSQYHRIQSSIYFLNEIGVYMASYKWRIGPNTAFLRAHELPEDIRALQQSLPGYEFGRSRLDAQSRNRITLFQNALEENDDHELLPTLHFFGKEGRNIIDHLVDWKIPREIAETRVELARDQLERYIETIKEVQRLRSKVA